MKQNKNSLVDEDLKRFKENNDLFASFLDLVPAKIYFNADDHLNWMRKATQETKKKPHHNSESQQNGENGKDDAYDDELGDEEEIYDGIRVSKFDPRVFKTVSQILLDMKTFEKKQASKNKKFSFTKQPVISNAEKNKFSVKLFNK